MLGPRGKLWLLGIASFLFAFGWCEGARAFTWTVRDGYTNCAPCHLDRSGAGPLTAYGRAIEEERIRTRFFGESESDDPTKMAAFLWGAVPLPDQLVLQGDVRFLHLRQKVEQAPLVTRNIWMQLDFAAGLRLGRFSALGTVGYADKGALAAALTRGAEENLITRQHWLGYDVTDQLQIRAGRLNLPFGLRSIEHTLWARSITQTNIDDRQQHGVAVALDLPNVRAELMAILGNYQTRPDEFRERGYSGFGEYALTKELLVGASSRVTYRELDPLLLKKTWRHAHGVFARWATPFKPLVLMSEWDYSLVSPRYDQRREGFVGFLQGDLEPIQGMHFMLTGEAHDVGVDWPETSYGVWLSYAWFFAPHADLRLDSLLQSVFAGGQRSQAAALLLQAHMYL